jgi:acetyl esterase
MTLHPIADYAALIDQQTWAFIRASEDWYPPDTATYSIERQREVYDAMCQSFHHGYPPGVTAFDLRLGGVACRRYDGGRDAPVTVVYFHGGGFVVGGLHSHDDVCAEICGATGYSVVSVDYRLAPEHLHPAQFDDALTATRAVAAADGHAIVLAGDSAGGCLAAAVAGAARDQSSGIIGQVLVYPGLGGDRNRGSYITHSNAPMLTLADVKFYEGVRFADRIAPDADPSSSPLKDRNFSGLPPTLVLGAECDPLCDDGFHYCQAIRDAGGLAHFQVEKGLVHGYLRARHSVDRARESFARLTGGIAALGQGEFPWRVVL